MAESITIKSCGTQHRTISQEMTTAYEELFDTIRQHFPSTKLSRFFPLQGEYYNEYSQLSTVTFCDEDNALSDEELAAKYMEPAVRFMLIGRSVNGWTTLTEETPNEFAQNAANTMTHPGFSWLRDDGQGIDTYIRADGTEARYNINKSSFFRCTKQILHKMKPITAMQDRWFEHMVWSNLYTVAPPDTGNAEGKLQDVQLEVSKTLLKQQIKHYAPTHILFMTDWDYWFDRFADIFPDVKRIGNSVTDNVVGYGTYENTKIVVSVRPDRTRPNRPDEEKFVEDVVSRFKSN